MELKELHTISNKLYLQRLWDNMNRRCKNPSANKYKNYGGRGIRVLLTKLQLKELWNRDKGYLLQKPSIDRLDSNGNYEISNCRFIEMRENIKNKWEKSEILTCIKCGKSWHKKSVDRPPKCRYCQSIFWDTKQRFRFIKGKLKKIETTVRPCRYCGKNILTEKRSDAVYCNINCSANHRYHEYKSY